MAREAYEALAHRLSSLGIGLPYREELIQILQENLSPLEAEVAALLPTSVGPLQPLSPGEVASSSGFSREEVAEILERLAKRGLLFSGRTPGGERGYALHQVGYGFPQSFFWGGERTPHARRMAELVAKYFRRDVTEEVFGSAATKPYRYIPLERSLSPEVQSVYSSHMMETVIQKAQVFARAQCPCRVQAELLGRGCDHPLEVCLKFDDMAEYLVEKGLGERISREEAREVVRLSAEAGLVHFVDNAEGDVKHNCNCCGCACWNVGTIRRRKIPRDVLMATYFLRSTASEACTGCGSCVEACPVAAVSLVDGVAVVDLEWCIGCGVCVGRCPSEAVSLEPRSDGKTLPAGFRELHETILEQKAGRSP